MHPESRSMMLLTAMGTAAGLSVFLGMFAGTIGAAFILTAILKQSDA